LQPDYSTGQIKEQYRKKPRR